MRKLLAIGIDNYDSLPPLKGCANDAKAFADLMKKNQNGTTNFQVQVEPNVSSTAELNRIIQQFFKGEGSTAVLYFSGHGIMDESGSYIAAPDYEEGNNGLLMDSVLRIANRSKFQDKIIILDCCHSGAFGSPDTTAGAYTSISNGTVILTASNTDESAFQVNGTGVFTSLLLEALKGGAADLTGTITPGSVYAYIDRALGPFDYQRPIFKTNVSRFTVLRKVVPPISPDILEKIIEYFPAEDYQYPLEPSYEETNNKETVHLVKKPFTDKEKVKIFKILQKYQSIGIVVPVNAEFMYWAAMNSTACKLTTLGQQYWRLIKESKFNNP